MNHPVDPPFANSPATSAPSELDVQPPVVRMWVEAINVDNRSPQFECTVHIDTPGPQRLRVISLRQLTPLGAEIQQVSDLSQSDSRIERDKLYQDLSSLVSSQLVESSESYRNRVVKNMSKTIRENLSVNGVVGFYIRLLTKGRLYEQHRLADSQRAWRVKIRNSERAEFYYEKFLQPIEGSQGELCSLYKAKLEDVRQIEEQLGDSSSDESVTDIEPGGSFSRNYVYNCSRRVFNPRIYTFSFDSNYADRRAGADQRHLSASISASISPKPACMNLLAILSAGLGSSLKIFLDLTKVTKEEPHLVSNAIAIKIPSLNDVLNATNYELLIAAMITGLFFYNIYDSTEIGSKINVGNGWRSALIVGGISGLLNQKVIAALQGLLG